MIDKNNQLNMITTIMFVPMLDIRQSTFASQNILYLVTYSSSTDSDWLHAFSVLRNTQWKKNSEVKLHKKKHPLDRNVVQQ